MLEGPRSWLLATHFHESCWSLVPAGTFFWGRPRGRVGLPTLLSHRYKIFCASPPCENMQMRVRIQGEALQRPLRHCIELASLRTGLGDTSGQYSVTHELTQWVMFQARTKVKEAGANKLAPGCKLAPRCTFCKLAPKPISTHRIWK